MSLKQISTLNVLFRTVVLVQNTELFLKGIGELSTISYLVNCINFFKITIHKSNYKILQTTVSSKYHTDTTEFIWLRNEH